MKIVIATGIFPPDIGGPATYVRQIAPELAARGYDVVVVTYRDAGVSIAHDTSYRVVGVSRRVPRGLRHMLYFFAVLRVGRGAGVVFAQDPVSSGLPALFAAKIRGAKFFIKIVGD